MNWWRRFQAWRSRNRAAAAKQVAEKFETKAAQAEAKIAKAAEGKSQGSHKGWFKWLTSGAS